MRSDEFILRFSYVLRSDCKEPDYAVNHLIIVLRRVCFFFVTFSTSIENTSGRLLVVFFFIFFFFLVLVKLLRIGLLLMIFPELANISFLL